MPAQAQKHVTHNEAIRALDSVVQLSVLDRDLTSPPASPAEGDRYIVGASASGGWSGQSGRVAAWQDGAWSFRQPRLGWMAWVVDEDQICVYDGATWSTAAKWFRLQTYTKATVPAATAAGAGALVWVTDTTGGPSVCVSTGADWRMMGNAAMT